jgi:hypothetical protein
MKNIGQVSGDYLYSGEYGPGNHPPDYINFGEDGQTFYVKQSDVDITNGQTWAPDQRNGTSYPYTVDMIGMPEWSIVYSAFPKHSDAAWTANYRTIGGGGPDWPGVALVARMMNAKALWNNDAFFDYVERYVAISKGNPDPFGYSVPLEASGSAPSGLIGAMWDTYRHTLNPLKQGHFRIGGALSTFAESE